MKFIQELAYFGMLQVLISGIFLSGIFYFTIFDKGGTILENIEAAKKEIATLEQASKKQEKELQETLAFKKSVEKNSHMVEKFLGYIPNKQSSIDVFTFLTKEAKESGVNIRSKRDEGVFDMDNYDALKVKLSLSGSFSQILLFLSRLTAQKRIMIVEHIDITLPDDSVRKVQASMSIHAYRYKTQPAKEEQEADNKDKEPASA